MSKIQSLAFLFLISLPISVTLQANENHPALDACFKKAKNYYIKNATPSDTRRGFEKEQFIAAGEIYSSDVVTYRATGSYHSGYFIDLIVADAKTCEVLDITNIYSE